MTIILITFFTNIYFKKSLILSNSILLSFLSKFLLVNLSKILFNSLSIYSLDFIVKKSFTIYIIIV